MERHRTVLPPEILVAEYSRLLREEPDIRALPLTVTGNSMSPFLIHGRDVVFLSRLTRPPRRGDILLYQRRSGDYILHRVWKAEAGVCTMVGDAQVDLEPGIRDDQIIAIVTSVRRKGRTMGPGSFWWVFFEKIWIRIVPWRHLIRRLWAKRSRS